MVGKPGSADLAFLLQVQQHLPIVLDRGAVIGGPVHLVQVDLLHFQALQRPFHFAADAGGGTDALGQLVGVRLVADQAAFGENERALGLRKVAHRRGHDFLGAAKAIDRRRVDPVHAA